MPTRAPQISGGYHGAYLPAAPVLARLRSARGGPYAALTDAGYAPSDQERPWCDKAVERAAAAGRVTLATADRLCCEVLGLHPSLVYGAAWWEALDQMTAVAGDDTERAAS